MEVIAKLSLPLLALVIVIFAVGMWMTPFGNDPNEPEAPEIEN